MGRKAAYFYPTTKKCFTRNQRAIDAAEAIGNLPEYDVSIESIVPDEHHLISSARPAFPGHVQPKIYCLDTELKDDSYTTINPWDDFDMDAIKKHLELMQKAGIDTVIFDYFGGFKRDFLVGQFQYELEKPMDLFFDLTKENDAYREMNACPLMILTSPRVLFPVSMNGFRDEERHYRDYFASSDSLIDMITHIMSKYKDEDNFLRYDNKRVFMWYEPVKFAENVEPHIGIESLKGTVREV
ncbi:hypothetical protein GF327_07305 [Candidatus Woesearchaeota archaeon]|nr:hypothetical protein [Candidatus Woesearchaeota archaeon]